MKIFNYHPTDLQLLYESAADEDPLDKGNFLIPGFATTVEPPEALVGFMRVFNPESNSWGYREVLPEETPEVIVPPTLEEVKEAKRQEIKTLRDSLESGGFNYMGKTLDSDERSVLRITCAALSAQAALVNDTPFTLNWVCKDNSILTLNATETVNLPVALALNGLDLHNRAFFLKEQIDNCTTVEEVEAITW